MSIYETLFGDIDTSISSCGAWVIDSADAINLMFAACNENDPTKAIKINIAHHITEYARILADFGSDSAADKLNSAAMDIDFELTPDAFIKEE